MLANPLTLGKPLDQVSVLDIAGMAVHAVENPDELVGERIDIASDRVTGQEAARMLSEVLGREIPYQQMPLDMVRQWAGEEVATMFENFENDTDFLTSRLCMPNTPPCAGTATPSGPRRWTGTKSSRARSARAGGTGRGVAQDRQVGKDGFRRPQRGIRQFILNTDTHKGSRRVHKGASTGGGPFKFALVEEGGGQDDGVHRLRFRDRLGECRQTTVTRH
ncbi:NmrA family NAD(P)-binding protein [Nonomuraea sp. NPDC050786]|uniref:NmrA family NAD(P)-binding protein n=1 Tax=Nonomuraea sp. NPDC050786 TaxID=3154840 RepID=UPI0033E1129B